MNRISAIFFPTTKSVARQAFALISLMFVLTTVFSPKLLLAYKLKLKTTLSRTAENHGHGLYALTQDVVFLHTNPPSVVRETWIIKSGESMKLRAYGKNSLKNKLALSIVYQGGQKSYLLPNGQLASTIIPKQWFEPYFFFRFKKNILPKMLKHQIIPESAIFTDSAPLKLEAIEELNTTSQPYVRLARVGGQITFGVGIPAPVNQMEKNPGLWISQDSFRVYKLRLPDQTEVKAAHYQKYKNRFWFPKERQVSWQGNKVKIIVVNISHLSQKSNRELSPKTLSPKQDYLVNLPTDLVVKDFYLKFR